jgi:tRNA A37 threonylcarbamoyladenosine dehydratase
LARSGVGRLLVVDFDRLTASSLNRHPIAGPEDIGRLKTEVLDDHLKRTCPETSVMVSNAFCHHEVLDELLGPGRPDQPDLIVDAIDSLNPKVALLSYCVQQWLPVLSSMGAAGRRDPTRIRVADLAQTRHCPLARQVRQRLRRRGVTGGVTCVYSEEVPASPREPDLADRTCERGRIRNRLPSQMSLPGIFGYSLASLALDWLAGGGEAQEPGQSSRPLP